MLVVHITNTVQKLMKYSSDRALGAWSLAPHGVSV